MEAGRARRGDDRSRRTLPERLRASAAWLFSRDRGPVAFVLWTTSSAYLVTVASLCIPWAMGLIDRPSLPGADPPATILLAALVLAPVYENLFLIGTVEFMRAIDATSATTVLVVALLSGGLHAAVGTWQAVAGFVLFATMAASYFVHANVRFRRRYAVLLAQHVLFNAPAAIGLAIQNSG